MKKMTVALLRVSTNMQELNSQRESIEGYCKRNNIVIDKYIEEKGVSGYATKLDDREALQELINLALEDKLDTVVVMNQDRIGRRLELLSFMAVMDEQNVKVISTTEGLLNVKNDDASDLMQIIKFWTARAESRKTSQRVKSAKLHNSKNEKYNGGKVNFGYKVVNGKLVIDEEKADIIRNLYQIYINYTTKECIEYLKQFDIKMTNQTVTQLLRNPIYKGIYAHDRKLYDKDDFKEITQVRKDLAIVSEEVWNRAREVAKERTTSKGAKCKALNRSTCEYEGLLEHWCGCKLTIDYDYRYKDKKRMFFKCKSCRTHKRDDYKKTYSANKLIPILDREVEKLFLELDHDMLQKKYDEKANSNLKTLNINLNNISKTLKSKIDSLHGANKKLELMVSQDVDISTIQIVTDMIKDLKSAIADLESKKEEVEAKIKEEKHNNENKEYIIEEFLSMKDIYNKGDYKQRRAILQKLISHITVKDYDDMSIYLNF